jgi:hypothetical protein
LQDRHVQQSLTDFPNNIRSKIVYYQWVIRLVEGHLPVFATAIASFRFVLTHRRALLRLGLLAVPAFLVVTLGLESFDSNRLTGNAVATDVTRSLLDVTLRAVVACIVLVAWHRVVMLKRRDTQGGVMPAFGPREIRYLLVWIGLSLAFVAVFAAVVVAMTALQFLAMLVLYVLLLLVGAADALGVGQHDQFLVLLWISVFFALPAASYVTGRLTLVLPALAIDRRRPFRQAWRMSAGNGWRLVAASLIVLVPMESIATMFGAAAAAARHTLAYVPLATLSAISLFLLIVLTGTVLSLFSLQLDEAVRRDEAYDAGIAVAD